MRLRPHLTRSRRTHSRLTRPAALVAALAASALLLAAPAAQAASGSDDGWVPYHGQDIDAPAGTVCSFHLHITHVQEGEETRTVARYPDGSPAVVLWRGPLFLRYTNLDTGAETVRDQSGDATEYLLPDGSSVWEVPADSHISTRIHPGNPYHAPGAFVFSGGAALLVHPDRNVQVLAQNRVENLCETLA